MDTTSNPEPGLALLAYVQAELEAASACLGWRGGRIHAGVHQARKSLRRIRAALALGGPALGPGGDWVDRAVRTLNRDLSSLRDAQALVEALDRLKVKAPDADTARLLRRARRLAAARRGEQLRQELAADPGLEGRRAVLRVLHAALQGMPWPMVTDGVWRQALANTHDRSVRAEARARDSADAEDWHRWRRRMRRLSQQMRALNNSGVTDETLPSFDKSLAEQLGKAQDLTLLLEHCRDDALLGKDDRHALRDFATAALRRQRRRIVAVAARRGVAGQQR